MGGSVQTLRFEPVLAEEMTLSLRMISPVRPLGSRAGRSGGRPGG